MEDIILEILSFYTYMCTVNEDNMIYGSWNIRCNRQKFLSFGPFFALSAPWEPGKSKFSYWKNTSRYYHFTHLHHKWQSCDVWSLRYGMQRTEFFVILDRFLSFYLPPPLTTQKTNILKKWKKQFEILSFYICILKMTIIWCMVPEISSATNRIFCHFGPFFPLSSP